jgi:hypothetical protein
MIGGGHAAQLMEDGNYVAKNVLSRQNSGDRIHATESPPATKPYDDARWPKSCNANAIRPQVALQVERKVNYVVKNALSRQNSWRQKSPVSPLKATSVLEIRSGAAHGVA